MRDIVEYTSEYLKDGFEKYQVKYRRRKVLEILQRYDHRSILEIGCGMEPLFLYLKEDDFDQYSFVEPSLFFYENALIFANGDQRITGVNALFDSGLFRDSLARKGAFDYVLCSGLLHEIEDPDDLMEQIRNVCEKETVVHINVPNAYSLHRLIAYEAGIIKDIKEMSNRNNVLQQNTVFDIEALKTLVVAHGFNVIDEGSFFIKPFSHYQMYRLINEGIIDDSVLDGLYKLEKYLPEYGSEIYVNIMVQ